MPLGLGVRAACRRFGAGFREGEPSDFGGMLIPISPICPIFGLVDHREGASDLSDILLPTGLKWG